MPHLPDDGGVGAETIWARPGGFIANASSIPWDSARMQSFISDGLRWAAYQFGDPATDKINKERFSRGDAERLRMAGVRVFGWWRVNHTDGVPAAPAVDGWVINAEEQSELNELDDLMNDVYDDGPVAVVTLGKMPGFPTGLLFEYDAGLIPECFVEETDGSYSVASCVEWWRQSSVPTGRIHPALLFKTGVTTNVTEHVRQADEAGVSGLSAYVLENTPPEAFRVMAA